MKTYIIRMRQGKPGCGKGALISNDLSLTLGCNNDQTLIITIKAAPSGGNQVPDIVVPTNSMVIGKDIKEGDRQTTGIGKEGDSCPTLQTEHHHAVASHLSVRRLLPVECERLMGFPDNWTKIPWRGKPADECPDAPRYKACGNSMGVNCMRWIGLGIEAVEAKHQK